MKSIVILGNSPLNFVSPVANELCLDGHVVTIISLRGHNIHDTANGKFKSISFDVTNRTIGSKIYEFLRGFFCLGLKGILAFIKKDIHGLKSLFHFYSYARLYNTINSADLLNIQQASIPEFLLGYVEKNTEVVLSFWGTDLFDTSNNQEGKQRLVNRASKITLQGSEMQSFFESNYQSSGKEIHQILFPLKNSLFGLIDDLSKKPNEKISIHIGYGGHPRHRHLEILEELKKMPKNILEKCIFVLKLNYGGAYQYIERVQSLYKIAGLDFKVILNKLTEKDLAKHKKEADIFINLQKTDAFSASLSEALYAETICIVGLWLPYARYRDNMVYMIELESMLGLSEHLEMVIQDIDRFKSHVSGNREKVINTLDYNGNLGKWSTLLSQINENRRKQ